MNAASNTPLSVVHENALAMDQQVGQRIDMTQMSLGKDYEALMDAIKSRIEILKDILTRPKHASEKKSAAKRASTQNIFKF